jgi:plasmid stability protein
MGSMLIRNIEDELKQRLRMRAAEHGRSMEEEARTILRKELGNREQADEGKNLVQIAREIFGPGRGVDLEPHPRVPDRDPPDFRE